MDTYCEWEWISLEKGVTLLGCDMTVDGLDMDMTPGKENIRQDMAVERVGDYAQFQCGLRFTVKPEHKGMWICEMEKYHWGFARRYGEVRTKAMALVVSGIR